LAGGLIVFTLLDYPVRRELPAIFLSGAWALLPDGHRFFRMASVYAVSDPWQTVHRSQVSNVFWFHHALDNAETGLKEFEIAAAFGVFFVSLATYYRFNDWVVDT
jgi:hypothetical protein